MAQSRVQQYLDRFLYPAVLGAGIAWWVQGLGNYISDARPGPGTWALAFGLWFLVYHGTWYEELHQEPKPGRADGLARALSAFFDVFGVLAAFVSLGFATGDYGADNLRWVWAWGALVPVAAIVSNYRAMLEKRASLIWVLLILAIPIAGFLLPAWSLPSASPTSWIWLAAFWSMLLLYVFCPGLYASQRSR